MNKIQIQIAYRPQYIFDHTELIEEKVEPSLQWMGTRKYFLNITPVSQTLRATMNKYDL